MARDRSVVLPLGRGRPGCEGQGARRRAKGITVSAHSSLLWSVRGGIQGSHRDEGKHRLCRIPLVLTASIAEKPPTASEE